MVNNPFKTIFALIITLACYGCQTTSEEVENTTDPSQLKRYALEDDSRYIQTKAIEKINDQAFLAEIVLTSTDDGIRIAALRNLHDQELLTVVATKDSNIMIRRAAVKNLTTQNVLADIAMNETDRYFQRDILAKMTDQAQLVRVLLSGQIGLKTSNFHANKMRTGIVKRLTEQPLLARVALEEKHQELQAAAAIKLTDQALLKKVVLLSKSAHIRSIVANQLEDQDTLRHIAIHDEEEGPRYGAVRQLNSQKALAEVASSEPRNYGKINILAVKKLKEQPYIAYAALHAKHGGVRLLAIDKLTDQKTLAHILLNAASNEARFYAANKTSDQEVLSKAALAENSEKTRRAIVKNLTNQQILAKIVLEEKLDSVRMASLQNLHTQEVLFKVGLQDSNSEIRWLAVKKITDIGYLSKIADEDIEIQQQLETEIFAKKRKPLIYQIHTLGSLTHTALTAYFVDVRHDALQLLKERKELTVIAKIQNSHSKLEKRVDSVMALNDNQKLFNLITDAEFDVVRKAAAKQLNEPALAENILTKFRLDAIDFAVFADVLKNLNVESRLNRIISNAVDPAIRLAAAKKAGTKSWDEIFTLASVHGSNIQMLDDAVAAVSLFPNKSKDELRDFRTALSNACDNLIANSDESRLPQMLALFKQFSYSDIALKYIKSGQPQLQEIAREWVRKNNLKIIHVSRPADTPRPAIWKNR